MTAHDVGSIARAASVASATSFKPATRTNGFLLNCFAAAL